jgi:hypothetical protein
LTLQNITGAFKDAIDGLKTSPALLMITIMNMLVLGSLLWFVTTITERDDEVIKTLMNGCLGMKPPSVYTPGYGGSSYHSANWNAGLGG